PYDIVGGLASCGELFDRFGGHRQAAGFTIANNQLGAMEERLIEHAGGVLAGYDLAPVLEIDAEWPLAGLRSQEIRFLGKLAPHLSPLHLAPSREESADWAAFERYAVCRFR